MLAVVYLSCVLSERAGAIRPVKNHGVCMGAPVQGGLRESRSCAVVRGWGGGLALGDALFRRSLAALSHP